MTPSPLPPLTEEVVFDLWSKTYNPNGKPDWSHIFPYYHENIRFQDTIQTIEGYPAFEKMCNRLTKRCQSLEMKIHRVAKTDHTIFLEWTMTMRFRRSPSTPIPGATRLSLSEDGRILEQRDYYDLWGAINDKIPLYRRFYRWFMKVVFG